MLRVQQLVLRGVSEHVPCEFRGTFSFSPFAFCMLSSSSFFLHATRPPLRPHHHPHDRHLPLPFSPLLCAAATYSFPIAGRATAFLHGSRVHACVRVCFLARKGASASAGGDSLGIVARGRGLVRAPQKARKRETTPEPLPSEKDRRKGEGGVNQRGRDRGVALVLIGPGHAIFTIRRHGHLATGWRSYLPSVRENRTLTPCKTHLLPSFEI